MTTVIKDGEMFFHLSGTNFFEAVDSEALDATRDVWDQSVVSENREVYRSEYLAYLMLTSGAAPSLPAKSRSSKVEDDKSRKEAMHEALLEAVQTFMAPRYAEGYVKGVHDHDTALILGQLLELDAGLDLLKYSTKSRALANLYLCSLGQTQERARLDAKLSSLGAAQKLFGQIADRAKYVNEIEADIRSFVESEPIERESFAKEAANYLFDQLSRQEKMICSGHAYEVASAFEKFIEQKKVAAEFKALTASEDLSIVDRFQIARDWVKSFAAPEDEQYFDEVATLLLDGSLNERQVLSLDPVREISGLLGDHQRVEAKTYVLDYNNFMTRLAQFQTETVPAFEDYVHLKKELVDQRRDELRLDEFKPRVLTSFVRNELINDTYLPMVGANLAKQMGVVGEDKRTDLMGLLLLISPPGYGKTTLMEYVANRLGITFMKINGPAIGHQVTSLDPTEAPNASSRDEIEKLNLALEMGDNVMIYVDDIQHCNPEFLQKFISLCDATRRIEGVFKGRTRTYDLRGRKVAVVMAGNPYTESGEKFQIPDMLASRADTYNLGDVIGDNSNSFEMSYLENSLTSNPTLARLNSSSRNDVFSIIKMAEHEEAQQTLEGNYSIEEVNEFVSVMKKLLAVRDVVLKVNREYIDSAAQADEYRTEPSFKLQGSYRDMNKVAEQLAPIMNDEELDTLITSHYINQAQTLTTGAQANLLKLDEIRGQLEGEDAQRWADIKRTFKRNLLLGAAGDDGQLGKVIAQMSTFSEGLSDIRSSLDKGINALGKDQNEDADVVIQTATMQQIAHGVEELSKFNTTLDQIKGMMGQGIKTSGISAIGEVPQQKIEVVNKVPHIFLAVSYTHLTLPTKA